MYLICCGLTAAQPCRLAQPAAQHTAQPAAPHTSKPLAQSTALPIPQPPKVPRAQDAVQPPQPGVGIVRPRRALARGCVRWRVPWSPAGWFFF